MAKEEKSRISGKDATHLAMMEAKYPPVHISESDKSTQDSDVTEMAETLPTPVNDATGTNKQRKAPPRVRKPSPIHNQYLAPTPDLDGYRARLREAFGNTLSDEFVDVMLGKLIEALKPNPFLQLEEPTLNAALAIIDSAQCRSELEALIAVEIVATGFAGLRLLRQSQHQMTEDFINTYGPYATKLLRLQLDLIQALDRHRRSHSQTVEVRHLQIHSGAQGMVGIVNAGQREGGEQKRHTTPCVRQILSEDWETWPEHPAVTPKPVLVSPAGRRRFGDGKGAECTAEPRARAGRRASVTAISSPGCGRARQWQCVGPRRQESVGSWNFLWRPNGTGGSLAPQPVDEFR